MTAEAVATRIVQPANSSGLGDLRRDLQTRRELLATAFNEVVDDIKGKDQ